MPRRIQAPDGTAYELPDDASDAEVVEFLDSVAPVERPSSMGFAKNVMTSGADLVKGVASPLMDPKGTLDAIVNLVKQPTETGRALVRTITDRYGSVDGFLATAYRDPVGMASDISLVVGGAATAAKAAGAPRAARALSAAAEIANPLSVPAKTAEVGGAALYKAGINPSRRIQREFPTAIQEGMDRNVLPTQGGLSRTDEALSASSQNTARLLTDAEARGARGVNVRSQVVPALKEPAERARARFTLGKGDERPDVSARARTLARRNPGEIPLTKANAMKQEAQKMADSAFRAEERGAVIRDLDALSDKNVAQALRKAVETNAAAVGVTGVAESNQRTQALIGLAQALEDATQQPSRLTNLVGAAVAGGSGVSGGPMAGAVAGTAYKALTSRTGMAATGLGAKKVAGPALRRAQMARALAVLRALDQPEEQGDEER